MADKKEFRWARLVIGVLVFGLVVVALVLQSLFAVRIEPVVVSAAPPEFIASILEIGRAHV